MVVSWVRYGMCSNLIGVHNVGYSRFGVFKVGCFDPKNMFSVVSLHLKCSESGEMCNIWGVLVPCCNIHIGA